MRAFILAGGFATRLWPLTEHRAKPLLPLAGVPIITHLINKVPREIPVTISTNKIFEQSFEIWRHNIDRDITIAFEEASSDDKKLGTNKALAEWIQKSNL